MSMCMRVCVCCVCVHVHMRTQAYTHTPTCTRVAAEGRVGGRSGKEGEWSRGQRCHGRGREVPNPIGPQEGMMVRPDHPLSHALS